MNLMIARVYLSVFGVFHTLWYVTKLCVCVDFSYYRQHSDGCDSHSTPQSHAKRCWTLSRQNHIWWLTWKIGQSREWYLFKIPEYTCARPVRECVCAGGRADGWTLCCAVQAIVRTCITHVQPINKQMTLDLCWKCKSERINCVKFIE